MKNKVHKTYFKNTLLPKNKQARTIRGHFKCKWVIRVEKAEHAFKFNSKAQRVIPWEAALQP